ncbi:MAG: metal-dependent transcriptional regulator [Micrococcaceae bacterium]
MPEFAGRSVSELSTSTQNYLKSIWTLCEWSDEPVTPSLIAGKAGVTLSSASDAMRKLAEQGLVEYERYGQLRLTPAGDQLALAMVRRHRLIETFLVTVLGYQWDEVHDEAESLEHAVSDLMIERIDEHLGHPSRDPHGDPIPAADGSIDHVAAEVLTALPLGQRARIERISDDDPELLQFFAAQGVRIGAVVEARASQPFSGSRQILLVDSETTIPLGQAATDSVWTVPV